MPREKKTTLFSKNHITIEKYENLQFYYTTRQEINQDKTGRCYYGTSSIASRNIKKIEIEGKKIDDEHVEVTKESPLGFYYKQIVNITRQIQYGTRKTVVLEYHYKDSKYILSFFIEYAFLAKLSISLIGNFDISFISISLVDTKISSFVISCGLLSCFI